MTLKKRKKKKKSFNFSIKDERIPKLFGVLNYFIALYLFIAFVAYIFTWEADQDKVLRFSWGLLLQSDLSMENWLGRLGAVISNSFFYWGFGVSSFIFVYFLIISGTKFIKGLSWHTVIPKFWRAFILLVFSSIFLGFVLKDAKFSYGGAFGQVASDWLENFVGTIGLIVLIFFILFGIIVWSINPNFNEMLLKDFVFEVRDKFFGYLAKPFKRERVKKVSVEEKTLKPKKEQKTRDFAEVQQSFDVNERRNARKEEALKSGEAELEIGQGAAGDSLIPASLMAMENKDHKEPYDPTLELSSYKFPDVSLLEDYSDQKFEIDRDELDANKDQIIETLLHYKIEITKIRATIGPTVTLYEIIPAKGVRISRIRNLEDDIALSLSALGIRIIAPIPGRGTIGIEVPNKRRQIVSMKEVLMSEKFQNAKMDLPIVLGKTISNEVFVADLAKMPHLLVAGATGQGKSVGINAILMSLLYKKHPSQVKFILIDPKKVELLPYANLENHFLGFLPDEEDPITTEITKVVHTLNSLIIEMEERYTLLKKAHTRNIREYNTKFVDRKLNPEKGHRFLPFIILVIDEFADLIMTAGKEIELPLGRLAQLSRAVGIHIVIATQRPSVNIITGVIKANFPARIAYKVASKVDSRTILDGGGADRLVGMGDMLLVVGADTIRLQGAFVDTPEIDNVIKFISDQRGFPEPFYLPEFVDDDEIGTDSGFKYSDLDENFEDAARLIVQNQHGSTSMIQRRMKLGFNRAGRIMDQLEALGIVGPSQGSKAREVLIFDLNELERYLEDIKNRN